MTQFRFRVGDRVRYNGKSPSRSPFNATVRKIEGDILSVQEDGETGLTFGHEKFFDLIEDDPGYYVYAYLDAIKHCRKCAKSAAKQGDWLTVETEMYHIENSIERIREYAKIKKNTPDSAAESGV